MSDFENMPDEMIKDRVAELDRRIEQCARLLGTLETERTKLKYEQYVRGYKYICCGKRMEAMNLFDDGGVLHCLVCKTCGKTKMQ